MNSYSKDIAEFNSCINNLKQHFDKNNQSFGLMCYQYSNGKAIDNYYSPPSANLGDYIQSLAALQYLPDISSVPVY